MPGLFDMLQPQNLQGTEPIGFGDALQQRSNSLIGLGLGLMQPTNPWAGTTAATNALRGYQSGNTADQAQARLIAAQKQHAEDMAFRRSQANKEPEAIRTMRLMGIDPNSPEARDLMYPKADNLHEGKITYREQEYPYLRDRRGNYTWPMGRPPGGPGSLPATAPPSTNVPAESTALPATAAPTAGTTAAEEPLPPGFENWLPSAQKTYYTERARKLAQEGMKTPQQQAAARQSASDVLNAIDSAETLAANKGGFLPTTGIVGGALSNVYQPSKDLQATLNTIKANVSLDKLNAMRQASTTGASGLGAVTESEHQLLQASIAALDQSQSPAQFAANLKRVRATYQWIIDRTDANQPAPFAMRPTTGSGGGRSDPLGIR